MANPITQPMNAMLCANCEDKGTILCTACQNILYCSEVCQAADGAHHDRICEAFMSMPSRPGPNYKRALLFAVNELLPRFIWVPHAEGRDYAPEFEQWLARPSALLGMNCSKRLGRTLPYSIRITNDTSFPGIQKQPNCAIATFLPPQFAARWRGGFIAHGVERRGQNEPLIARDLDTECIGPIVDCLTELSNDEAGKYSILDEFEASN